MNPLYVLHQKEKYKEPYFRLTFRLKVNTVLILYRFKTLLLLNNSQEYVFDIN